MTDTLPPGLLDRTGTLHVAVGSANASKVGAVLDAFARLDVPVQHSSWSVPSEVRDQPLSHEETRRGALNRATGALRSAVASGEEPAFSVGIESGLYEAGGSWFEATWVCVLSGGAEAWASGASFPVPEALRGDLEAGLDLTQAMERAVGVADIGNGTGFYGYLTHERYDRRSVTADAVLVALTRWLRPELWARPGA